MTTPPSHRELLAGNADLAELAAHLPRDRRSSSWDVVAMVLVTVVMVTAALVITSQFGQIYKELGVQLPARTQDVLSVWFHVAVLVTLALPCMWRQRAGKASWAVPVWFLLMLLYAGFMLVALFMPLISIGGTLSFIQDSRNNHLATQLVIKVSGVDESIVGL